MKSMNDESGSNFNINNWLGFSLSPHIKMEATTPQLSHNHHFTPTPSTFYLCPPPLTDSASIYTIGENNDFLSPLSVMPLKSDGSLCIMEPLSRSHSQVQNSSSKLEDYLSEATMASHRRCSMVLSLDNAFYNEEPFRHQPHYYSGFTQIPPPMGEIPCLKAWMDDHHALEQNVAMVEYGGTTMTSGDLQPLSLSMSPGSQSSCVTASTQISPTENTDCVAMETKKRGPEKMGKKQTVHRKSIDSFGQRTSQYRGVTRHRWTGRYEAHLWDNSCKKEGQTRKGRQVYLGGYDMEEKAARAYDLAALKYWGPSTHINFALENYQPELEEMKDMSRQEYVAHLRRKSSGFSRGASIYRGVTRHHQHGRWQARIGRVAGNKDLYLGTFSTQEEAAEAYDIAAIKFRGVNAVTNFDISRYDVEKITTSNTLPTGDIARRNKETNPNAEAIIMCNATPQVDAIETSSDWNNDASGHHGNLTVGSSLDHKTLNRGSYQSPPPFSVALHNLIGLDSNPTVVDKSISKTLNRGSYQSPPPFSVALHNLIGLDSNPTVVDKSNSKMGPPFSNASSLVTSLNSSREGSPEKYGAHIIYGTPNSLGSWIQTGPLRPGPIARDHMPIFATWNNA